MVRKFLSKWNGIIVIISHDRTFLDSSINCVYEISMRKISTFNGNYSSYITEKGKRLDIKKKHTRINKKRLKKQNDSWSGSDIKVQNRSKYKVE